MTDTNDTMAETPQNSRAFFEPLGFADASDDLINGSEQRDTLRGDPLPASPLGLPGALAFWHFDQSGMAGRSGLPTGE